MSENSQKIYDLLYEIVGEAGCGVSCSEAEIYKENGQWHLFREGFMDPWPLGASLQEAHARLREYASQGFGLS